MKIFPGGSRFNRLIPVLLFLLPAVGHAAAPAGVPPSSGMPSVLWEANTGTFTESGASVADINRDGLSEIVVAGREEVIALGARGKVLWRWRTKARLMTYPAVLARPDGPALIYVADTAGNLLCLDGLGRPVWEKKLNRGSSWSASVPADLEGDGTTELIQTDESGAVSAFHAATGESRWKTEVGGKPVSPAVADLNGDGRLETAVYTDEGSAVLLDASGKILWKKRIGGLFPTWGVCAPVMFPTGAGEGRIVFATREGQVFCLDAGGIVRWTRRVRGAVAATISVCDFDDDQSVDVFLITQLGVIYRFDEEGAVLWENDMGGRTLAAGSFADLDRDGRLEYVLATQDGHMMALNREGAVVFDYQFPCRTINVTPAFGEVDSDRPGIEMVITGGESGRIYCFQTSLRSTDRAEWTAYRGSERKTGAWSGLQRPGGCRMLPVGLDPDRLLSSTRLHFRIENPSGEALQAEAWCLGPDGARQAAVSRVLGKQGVLEIPLQLRVSGTYQLGWRLVSLAGQERFRAKKSVSIQAGQADRRAIQETVQVLRREAPPVPGVEAAFHEEAARLEQGLRQMDSPEFQGAPDAAERTEQLVQTAFRDRNWAQAARAAKMGESGASPLMVFEAPLWESRPLHLPVVPGLRPGERRVVPGEHDPVSLGVLNLSNRTIHAQVRLPKDTAGMSLQAHRIVPVVTAQGRPAWDALPRMDDSQILTIPSWSVEWIWLDIRFGDAKPGPYRLPVRILALDSLATMPGPEGAQTVAAPEITEEIRYRLLPFSMAPPGAFRLCAWAAMDPAAFPDMLDHGNNVFITPTPKAQYDAAGKNFRIDTAPLDQLAGLLAGRDIFLLLNGAPRLQGAPGSPEYAREFAAYCRELIPLLQARGFDREHFAFYPVDEPGGLGWDAVNQVVAFGKLVKSIDPALLVYIDGGGELPMFEAMAPFVDIWTPGIRQLAESSPEMALVRKDARHLWSYDCAYSYARPTGANIKDISLVPPFRTAALFALRHGASGIGYWAYNHGDDPWQRQELEYPLVYPGRSAPVASRRWEGVREGIEDFRILKAMQTRLLDKTAPVSPAAEAAIRQLVGPGLAELLDRNFQEMNMGLPRYVFEDSLNEETMQAFRRLMMDGVELLTATR